MSKQDRFDKKKDASARSAAAEQAKQDKLRKQQESKNPPKMSRDDIKRARRMPGEQAGGPGLMSTEVRHVQHWDMTIRRGDGDERWEDETRVYPSGAQKFRPQLIHVKISEDGSYRASLSGPRILKRGPVGEELTRRYGLPSWVIQIIQRERELHGLTGPMERPDEP